MVTRHLGRLSLRPLCFPLVGEASRREHEEREELWGCLLAQQADSAERWWPQALRAGVLYPSRYVPLFAAARQRGTAPPSASPSRGGNCRPREPPGFLRVGLTRRYRAGRWRRGSFSGVAVVSSCRDGDSAWRLSPNNCCATELWSLA